MDVKVSKNPSKMTDFKSRPCRLEELPDSQPRAGGSNIRKNVPLWDGLSS
jgi:hypothetical protein